MNIEKINQSITEFCTAAGFEFGTMKPTPENINRTKKFILEEVEEYEKETYQPAAAKELIDIAYFLLTESYRYGVSKPFAVSPQDKGRLNPKPIIDQFCIELTVLEEDGNIYAQKLSSWLLAYIEKEVGAMNFDFQACFDAVHTSNMSKFLNCKRDAEIALIECQNAKNDKGEPKYGMLGIVECGGVYSIKDANSGKVVKEHSFYHKADLSGCVKLK